MKSTSVRSWLWKRSRSGRVLVDRLRGRLGPAEPTTSGRICRDVAAWSSEHQGARPRELFPGREVVRRPPGTVEPSVDPVFTDRLHHRHGRRYITPVDGARLVGSAGLVVLPDRSAAVESVFWDHILETIPEFATPSRRSVERRRGPHFSLLVPWTHRSNFYHWFHDSLLRLHDVIDDLPDDTSYLVPGWMQPFQYETLALFGIGRDRLVHCTGHTIIDMETLHFATATSASGHHRAEADRWLSQRMRTALGVDADGGDRRIYLSRRNASRRVANESDVVDLLADFGFEVVVPDTLSLREQVVTFAQASTIVGAHGAALYNMIHSPEGAVVIDMIGPSLLRNGYIFWNQAQELGHDYWYLKTSSTDPADGQADTVVPLDRLEATLAAAGISRR